MSGSACVLKVTTLLLGFMNLAPAAAGEIRIGGTGAVLGLATRLGEAFSATHPLERIEFVPNLGSSGGIQAVRADIIQVSFTGRALKDQERASGLRDAAFVETPFLFVSSHPKPQNLTTADVTAIFSGTLTRWPDDQVISPILRPKGDSDTALLTASFQGMEAGLATLRQRPDIPITGTDQDNLELAESIPYSLTGATLIQIITERPRVNPIALDGIAPTLDRLRTGEYALKKRLYTVTGPNPTAGARTFLAFLRSEQAMRIIVESGGLPLLD